MNRIDSLMNQLTLEEKVSLLAGASMWTTVPIQREFEGAKNGIPALKVTDGPNGARGGIFEGGVKAACFPVGIALAATWNPALVEKIGQALGQEVKSKGAQVLLAPTVNIHRSPLNGRNFECYSEDPYLSSRMAVAYIRGLQSQGVGATVKHYICNDSEFQRQSISSEVDERPLHELYLPPFKAAVQEAGTWCLMTSYNRVNGEYVSDSYDLLTDVLRKELGFEGLVMSDWMGTYSTAPAVNAGQDLEMPGPSTWRAGKLLQAVKNGEVAVSTINKSVRRLLELLDKAGRFEHPKIEPEQANDQPEHHALIRQAGDEAMVLLKNNGVLPLDKNALKSIALIGPNAKVARIQGGGSAGVNPHYAVTPFEGVNAKLDANTKVGYEIGCSIHKLLPLIDPAVLGPEGLKLTFYNTLDLSGTPAATMQTDHSNFFWLGQVAEGVDPRSFSGRITSTLKPAESGEYTFALSGLAMARLSLDGKEVVDFWDNFRPAMVFMGEDLFEAKGTAQLEAGKTYDLEIVFRRSADPRPFSGLRIGMLQPIAEDCIECAAQLAGQSDVAVVFAGFSSEWESEGFDRPDMELAGEQNRLIEQVAAENPNTIVVLNTGSPVTMPWLDKVAAVVQAWYPGQECGNAIADVLFGDANPSGKLPQTFPARLEDNPAYVNYPGENGKVRYGEGLFVGYRYYDKKKVVPLFPFGFGLSYTSFAYGPLSLSAEQISADDTLEVTVEVTNTGDRVGKEVVQLYIRDVNAHLVRPEKELKAFAKIELQPGECQPVRFTVGSEALSYYDDLAREWVAEPGEFEVLVGSSSQDMRSSGKFTLK